MTPARGLSWNVGGNHALSVARRGVAEHRNGKVGFHPVSGRIPQSQTEYDTAVIFLAHQDSLFGIDCRPRSSCFMFFSLMCCGQPESGLPVEAIWTVGFGAGPGLTL